MVAKLPAFPAVQPNGTTVGVGTKIGSGSSTTMVSGTEQPLPEVTVTIYVPAFKPLNNGESCFGLITGLLPTVVEPVKA
ncbi:hypothetical protein FLB_10480 [Flavobacterium succinicans]|uniref:Uncharacterized protein n=1 Tax=Flavobacterium succinicans TaxID=29536 RepID=A0A199XS11_9FLAO|nr:hypothetical protein FLB_10480 [Flavobacterium succinicans]